MHRIFTLVRNRTLRYKHATAVPLFYSALLLLSLHWALVLYVNSSFLGSYFSSAHVSLLYALGSLVSLICFYFAPRVLRSIGNYKLTMGYIALEVSALVGMSLSTTAGEALFYFLLHFCIVPLLLFNLDVFLEEASGDSERKTGSIYGLKLSLLSLASACAQLFVGNLTELSSDSFTLVYIASALLLVPFAIVIHYASFRFQDPAYIPPSAENMLSIFRNDTDIRKIVAISFFLQLFFSAMVIYVPFYLVSTIGFSWSQIGAILFVGLMAYVFFEWPIGIIADRYIGEKEMMAVGFVIMAVSVSWFAFLTSTSVLLWMIAMFLSRVGASLVETTTESYFFKHAISVDTHKISLFRMTNPLGAIAGASLGSLALMYMPLNLLFIALAFAMLPGLFITLFITDTK